MLQLNYEIKTTDFHFYLDKKLITKKYIELFKKIVINGLKSTTKIHEINIPTADNGFVTVVLSIKGKDSLFLKYNSNSIIKNTVNLDILELKELYKIITNEEYPSDISL